MQSILHPLPHFQTKLIGIAGIYFQNPVDPRAGVIIILWLIAFRRQVGVDLDYFIVQQPYDIDREAHILHPERTFLALGEYEQKPLAGR